MMSRTMIMMISRPLTSGKNMMSIMTVIIMPIITSIAKANI